MNAEPEDIAGAMVATLAKYYPELRFVLIVAAPKEDDEGPRAFALGAASSLSAADATTALGVAVEQFASLADGQKPAATRRGTIH